MSAQMARLRERIRAVKPEIRRSQSLAACSIGARLTFHLLITLADDEGRFEATPSLLKADLYPLNDDIRATQVIAWCQELERHGMVHLYEVAGLNYGEMANWHHQRIDKPTKSELPPKPIAGSSRKVATPREASRQKASVSVSVTGSVSGPGTYTSGSRLPWGSVVAIFETWQTSTGRTRARLDDKRGAVISKALKAYSPEDVEDAVQGWANDPWEERPRHNDISILLRDAAHIEKFRDLHRQGAPSAKPKKGAVSLALDQFERELRDATTTDGAGLGDSQSLTGKLLAGPFADTDRSARGQILAAGASSLRGG